MSTLLTKRFPQHISYSWMLTVFTFILDLTNVNAQAILKHISEIHQTQFRKTFLINFALQLRIGYIHERF